MARTGSAVSALRTRPTSRWLTPSFLVPLAAALLLVYLVVFPLVMLVRNSFEVETGLGFDNYVEGYSSAETWALILNSMIFAVGSAALAFVMGATLAWIVVRTNVPGGNWFFTLNLIPLVIPGLVNTVAWIFLLSPQIGWVNIAAERLLGLEAPVDIFTMGGMIWIEGLHLSPLAFLLMAAAFKSMDASMEEAAMTSGAGTGSTLRRITLPLILPASFAVVLIMFVRAVESFETPAIVGIPGQTLVLTSKIFLALERFPPDFGAAGVLSVGLLSLGALGAVLYLRMTANSEAFSTITGKAFRPRVLDLGRWRAPAFAGVVVYFIIIIGLPTFTLLWISLLPFYQTPSLSGLDQVSLENYASVLGNPLIQVAFKNTLLITFATATVIMALTAVIAWITVKTRLPGRGLLDLLAFVPIAIPGLVIGIAMIQQYINFPVPIFGTIWILIIAYVVRFLPYGMRANSAAMIQIHRELEEAGAVSGSNRLQTFRRIILPLLRPGFVAGFIFIVIFSARELSASIFLANTDTIVLSLLMFQLFNDGRAPALAALSIMMMGVLVIVALSVHRIGGFFGLKE